MSNTVLDAERLVGHGLDAGKQNPWVNRILRKATKNAEKSWAAEHITSHAAANENDTGQRTAPETIPVPMQRILLEHLDLECPLDTASHAERTVHETVRQALHELLPADAMLYVPSEDFHRIHQDLQKQAETFVKDSVALASKHSKSPVNIESMRRSLHRELASPKFKDRHHELLSAVSRAKLPPELGTARNV